MTRLVPGRLTFRPLALEDAVDLYALYRRCRRADHEADEITFDEFVYSTFELPRSSARLDSVGAVDEDGRLVGYGWAFTRESATRSARAWLTGGVDPEYRRQGIGTGILRRGVARAVELLAGSPPNVPHHVDAEAGPAHLDRIALFEQEGFESIRTFMTMLRPLGTAEPAPEPGPAPERDAAGEAVRIVDWRDDLDEATRTAHNEAFLDHWGSEPISPDRWRYYGPAAPGFRASLSPVAVTPEGNIAGYVMCSVPPGMQAERRTAWIGTVGVCREFRRLGIGRALVARALRAMEAAGFEAVGLDVDADNPTGAVRLYERLGFRPHRRQVIYSKAV